MQKHILLERKGDQSRLAVIEDGELVELYVEQEKQESLMGNIYVGRVDNVLPGMQSAFVDIGIEKNGFLPLPSMVQGGKPVRPGDQLLVQVFKEPGADKGPRLTMDIALPGRMLVLTPTEKSIGISKKIELEEERERLRAIAEPLCPENMGLIMRTAADGASGQAIAQDIEDLVKLWRSIEAHAPYHKAPALVHQNMSLVDRSVRDMLQPDVQSLIVEGKDLYDQAVRGATAVSGAPALVDRIMFHSSEVPLFTLYRVESQSAKALDRRVWLKSGGYLVIDYTEAMTVIDVNSGKFVGDTSLSETVFRTNMEAVGEIARQLRLRDIGGIVIVDFIDMNSEEQREQLISAFREELKKDRTKTNLIGMTKLGLVEMTRKKLNSSMLGARAICPTCKGSGRVDHHKKEHS